ncbi:type II secretion system F family protein [Halobaculum sp. P14]|uniref:type II secretion system F family protein n=1 Tax=Halobaculum sp. P14 TaxID=3421638 RepID=UPI003EC06DA2
MLEYVPLLVSLAVLAVPAAAWANPRVSLATTRVALAVFGDYVAEQSPRKREQQERLRAAHVATTHRAYASRTLLYAGLLGVAGSVLGVYGIAALFALLRLGGAALRTALPPALGFLANFTRLGELGAGQLFPLLLLSSATVGAGAAVGTYYLRWALLDQRAQARAGRIESTLPRTVAFMYALSRSGMSFPAALNTLAENESVYGEAASELGVAVRDMNTFGTDVLTALERMAARSPSQNLSEFGENLASVLGSGQSLSEFLRGQYERYQEEAESQQEQYLELLSTLAEAYVTVLVAGPLFFITILVVIGLVLRDTTDLLRVVVYAGVPLASAAFVVYIDSMTADRTGGVSGPEAATDPRTVQVANARSSDETAGRTDGGVVDGADAGLLGGVGGADWVGDRWTASRERLAMYDRLKRLLAWLDRPLDALLERPAVTAAVTVPVGVVWVLLRAGAVPLAPLPALRTLDSPVFEATLFAFVVFGVVYEADKRRTRAMEEAVPDFLDRMASINDAGMTVVESIERLTQSDLERLTPEVQRTWRDIQWGADASAALERMEKRVRSPMVSRAVALITNAIAASGDVAPVLEIAADEARATRRLRRERRQVMVTYLLVIYVSFFVFVGIVAALTVSFIPAVENAQLGGAAQGVPGTGISGGVFSGLSDIDTSTYVTLFYHAAAIQSVCSGLIAGQLGEGDVRDGVKHAAVMLAITYAVFAYI